ncbi:MAG: holo-ACP synthase [Bacilli bacterium]
MNFMIGVDSERIDRFKVINYEKYCKKFLSVAEKKYFKTLQDSKKQKFIASRFSSKEAIFKALGIGIDEVKFSDITILSNDKGKPIVDYKGYNIELSITYNDTYVTTFVIIEL